MRLSLTSELLTQLFSDVFNEEQVRVIYVKYDAKCDSVQLVLDGVGAEIQEGAEIPITSIDEDAYTKIQSRVKDILNESIIGALM